MRILIPLLASILMMAVPEATAQSGTAAGAAPDTSATKGKRLLFVLQESAAKDVVAADAKVRERLEVPGFAVEVSDQKEPASRADGKDLVLISSCVSANRLEGKYRNVTVPVGTREDFVLAQMGMSGKMEGHDFGTQDEKGALPVQQHVAVPHVVADIHDGHRRIDAFVDWAMAAIK